MNTLFFWFDGDPVKREIQIPEIKAPNGATALEVAAMQNLSAMQAITEKLRFVIIPSLPNVPGQTCEPCAIAFMGSLNRIVCSRWLGSVVFTLAL